MGLFDKFRKKKPAAEEVEISENAPKIIEPNVITGNTNDKYLPFADEIIPALVSLLRKLNDIEGKASACGTSDREKYTSFKKEYGEIAGEICTAELLGRGYLGTIHTPTKYGYINKGCDLEFVMKSAKQASVIMYNDRSKPYLYTYRFVFKNIDDFWKLNSVSCRLGDDDSWHADNI